MTGTITASVRVTSVEMVVSPEPKVPVGRNRRVSSRSVIVVTIIAFLAIQGGSFVAINADAVPIRDPIFAEKLALLRGHPEFFQQNADSLRVLAIGSSRTQLAFDAGHLGIAKSTSFNFGCAGCGPIASALYFRRLLALGMTTDVALIEIHPAMLAAQNPPFEHRWLHGYRLRHEEVERIRSYGWPLEMPQHLRTGGWLQTLHTYRFSTLNEYAPGLLPCPFGMTLASRTDAYGFIAGIEPTAAERAVFLAGAQIEYAPAFASYTPGGPAVEAVRDMLSLCRERGIRAVIVVSPESSEFRSWYVPQATADVDNLVRTLAAEFAVPLMDAREWLPDNEFADGHHPTVAGARRFTERLARSLP